MEQKYIQEAFDTNWVVPLGPNVDGFEEDLKGYLSSSKEVVALASGTAAVHLSLLAAGVGAGVEEPPPEELPPEDEPPPAPDDSIDCDTFSS